LVPAFCVVVLVVLITGLLGGIRNWIWEDLPQRDQVVTGRFWARILDGIIAASAVPLFLTVIGNEKVTPLFSNDGIWNAAYAQALLILISFCALAAVFSQRFLNSLSEKVMQLNEKVDRVEQKVEQSAVVADLQIEADLPAAVTAAESAPSQELSGSTLTVLRALGSGQFLMRSKSGLSESTSLSVDAVSGALTELEGFGLVRKLSTSKGDRWALTDEGRMAWGQQRST
jgi:outer membrane murein-binding lipoprotein Lpp